MAAPGAAVRAHIQDCRPALSESTAGSGCPPHSSCSLCPSLDPISCSSTPLTCLLLSVSLWALLSQLLCLCSKPPTPKAQCHLCPCPLCPQGAPAVRPQKSLCLWSDPVKSLPAAEPRTSGAAPLLATLFSLFT